MTKKYGIFITCFFGAFLAIFLAANALTPDKEFSPMENRNLAQAPQVTADDFRVAWPVQNSGDFFNGTLMKDFEDYVTDQFVLRDQWIALKAGTEAMLGKQENNGVYLCEKDTLIARFDPPRTDRERKRIDQNFGYVDTFAEKWEGKVYFSLIPGKVSLWADRLPLGAPNDDEGKYLARGEETKADWIDLNAALSAHKDEDIYYRTDHHWTSLGAYYGYKALVEGMGMEAKPLSDFTPTVASDSFYGTTFSTSGVRWVKPDAITRYVPQEAAQVTNYFDQNPTKGQLYDLSKLEEKDKYSMFLGGNKPKVILESNVAPPDAPKLLVVRDSFSDSLAPFLCYNFSEIHLIDPRYNKGNLREYMQENGIDTALVLYSVANFVSDGNLFVLGM